MNTDPSQYPDENPLAQKEGGSKPTTSEVQDYADGVVDLRYVGSPDSYVYRGTDEAVLNPSDSGDEMRVHLGTSPTYHRK